MKTVLETIREQAKKLNRKICLTESDDIRNLKAAEKLVQLGYARPVLVAARSPSGNWPRKTESVLTEWRSSMCSSRESRPLHCHRR